MELRISGIPIEEAFIAFQDAKRTLSWRRSPLNKIEGRKNQEPGVSVTKCDTLENVHGATRDFW